MTTTYGNNQRLPRWGPRALWAATFAAVIILMTLAAACSGNSSSPGVAAVDPTTAARRPADRAKPSGSSEPDAVAYAQCMRDNGVPHFPDPNSNGNFDLALSPDKPDLDFNSPQFQAAQEACKSLEPRRSAEQEAKDYAARLDYAKCMRDQGISDFPDPPAPGTGPNTQSQSGQSQFGSNLDPQSPLFQAAHKACTQYLPAGDEGPSTNQGGH